MRYSDVKSPYQLYAPRKKPDYDWGESLTDQEFKDECNTEKILERFSGGPLPLPAHAVHEIYRDCTDMRNLQQHLDNARSLVLQAENGFMQLDAKIRRRFDHDVSKMAAWLADPENDEEAVRLGLKTRRVPVAEPKKEEPPPKEGGGSTPTT